MPPRSRSTYHTDWVNPFTGEVHRLGIRHTRNYLGQGQDHLEIETAKSEQRRDHPLSATGYLSHFIAATDLINAGGPVTFVDAWIARALTSKEWRQTEQKKQQGDLFQWADAKADATKRKPATRSASDKAKPAKPRKTARKASQRKARPS